MIRLLLILALLFVLAGGMAFIAGQDGNVTIALETYEIQTSFAFFAAIVGMAFAVGAGLVWLIGFVRSAAPVVGTGATARRQRRGLTLINRGMSALAAGEFKSARQLAREAESLLPDQPLAHLLAAEASLKLGERAAAQERFEKLEQSPDGRFIGLRGLMMAARRDGRSAQALELARQAYGENKKSPWVVAALFSLEVEAGHWSEARDLLKSLLKQKHFTADDVARHGATLNYCEGNEKALAGDKAAARSLYEKALKSRPGFSPAVAALARLDHQMGRNRPAEKRLKAAWAADPHPAIVRAWRALDPAVSRVGWLGRVDELIKGQPDHMYAHQLKMDAAIQAGDLDMASTAADALHHYPITQASAKLLIDLGRAKGEDVAELEEKLMVAPKGQRWECRHCGEIEDLWKPICDRCGEFDQLDWKTGEDPRPLTNGVASEPITLLSQGNESLQSPHPE